MARYNAEERHKREETERFRAFSYEELVSRDKANLDIFWLRDKSLEGSEDLQPPLCDSGGDRGEPASSIGTVQRDPRRVETLGSELSWETQRLREG